MADAAMGMSAASADAQSDARRCGMVGHRTAPIRSATVTRPLLVRIRLHPRSLFRGPNGGFVPRFAWMCVVLLATFACAPQPGPAREVGVRQQALTSPYSSVVLADSP